MQEHFNCPIGAPSYPGDTCVSSINDLMYQCLFYNYSSKKFVQNNDQDNSKDKQFNKIWHSISEDNWTAVQEMESVTSHISKYA